MWWHTVLPFLAGDHGRWVHTPHRQQDVCRCACLGAADCGPELLSRLAGRVLSDHFGWRAGQHLRPHRSAHDHRSLWSCTGLLHRLLARLLPCLKRLGAKVGACSPLGSSLCWRALRLGASGERQWTRQEGARRCIQTRSSYPCGLGVDGSAERVCTASGGLAAASSSATSDAGNASAIDGTIAASCAIPPHATTPSSRITSSSTPSTCRQSSPSRLGSIRVG